MIKLSGNDVTFGENTVSQSGQRMVTKSGIRGSVLSGKRLTGFHWNGHRFPPPESGSVLYLPGYPAQGSVIQDFSGQGNDGAITGATWKRLPSGLWYLDFDSDGEVVTVDDSSSLRITDAITILYWIKLPGNVVYDGICFKGTNGTFGDWGAFLQNNKQEFSFNNSLKAASNTAFSDAGVWELGAMTYDKDAGGTEIKYFLNGQADGTADYSTVIQTSAEDFKIGHLYNVGYSMVGALALFRVFNRALPAVKILSYYNREKHLFGV